MKTQIFTLATALFLGTAAIASNPPATTTFSVDTKESKVFWTGKKVSGEHTGDLSISKGQVIMDGERLTGGSFVFDMNSITCTDLTDAEYNAKLVGHLKSDDFFGVKTYPTGEFVITKAEPIAGAKDRENNYTITGDLTLKGKTQSVTFPAYVTAKNGRLVAKGAAQFDRTKFDIKYGSGQFFDGLGDSMIYDDVTLNFVLSGKQGK